MNEQLRITYFIGKLRAGTESAYKEWHDNMSAEILALYKSFGIVDIHLYREGCDLVMVVATERHIDLAAATVEALNDPVLAKWVGHSAAMFEDDGAWRQMERFFEFPKAG